MRVLLLDDNATRHEEFMLTFLKAGVHITATDSVHVAKAFLGCVAVDLLIASEELNGCLTHAVALLAEHLNPMLSTVLISDRVGDDVEELYDLIPSVHCIVGTTVSPETILHLGQASISSKAANQVSQERKTPVSVSKRRAEQAMKVAA